MLHLISADSSVTDEKQICVDVSIYPPITWTQQESEECRTEFVQKCEERSEQVCGEVSETLCQIVPYTQCKLTVSEEQVQETTLVPRRFTEKSCVTNQRNIPHRKLMPECTNVTKQNCVLTNWETDEYGNQVWAGNEECDPISWQECKLVPKDVKLGRYLIFRRKSVPKLLLYQF